MSETTDKKAVVDINTPLIKLALPVFIQALLSMLIGSADTLMLSQYSDIAVGAVGNANQVLGFLTLAFTIISSATGVVVSQYLGAKENNKISKIYTVSIAFNLLLSATISLIVFAGSKSLLTLIQVPEGLIPDAVSYIKIVGGYIFLQALIEVFNQILRSNGKVLFGMIVALAMNIFNIGGNWLVLYGPLSGYFSGYGENGPPAIWGALGPLFGYVTGATGVAISSVVSRLVGLTALIIYFHFKIEGSISIKHLNPFPKDILLGLIRLGIPTAGENISYNISQVVITSFVNTLGLMTINTKTYCTNLTNFSYLYSISVAMATQIIVGHAVGAGKYDFAYKRVYKSILPSEIVSVGIAVVNYLISPITLSIFTDNPACIALGQDIMLIAVFLEIGRTCNLVIINSMRAAGDVKFPTYLGIGSMWGISVLGTYILVMVLPLDLGLRGVWIAMAADEILRGIVVLIRWKR
ncbi:MAG: MATE family efflux transporter, partial [Lachnospiraceae bacterium]|nr:MATE family efflux transporter [Lachnospiraceae bacterium]